MHSSQQIRRIKSGLNTPRDFCRHYSPLTREEMATLADIFPCQSPCTPGMASLADRVSTFAYWPGHIDATVEELAEAGFMFLGEKDRVKCFYCNGGLQKWQPKENPWYEHAKWFPNCEYLLRKRGIEYVESVTKSFPDLNRPHPISSNQESRNIIPTPHACSNTSSSPGVTESDDMETSSSSSHFDRKKSVREAMDSMIVNGALSLGFEEDLIYGVVKKKLETENAEYSLLYQLVEDLQKEEERLSALLSENSVLMDISTLSLSDKLTSENSAASSPPRNGFQKVFPPKNIVNLNSVGSEDESDDDFSSSSNEENVMNRLQDIVDEQTCKVCLDRKRNCVFQPCGHACCCVECALALNVCPICREKLKQIIKFYR